jgi:acyl-CoA reductase-like NAD-dependent aldehyde dehydrogenase
MMVRDVDEAIRMANDSVYGLQASVWSRDTEHGERVARQIEAGASNVNEHQMNYLALEAPMGGWKSSGLGTRHGADGIRKYTRQQTSVVTRWSAKKELFMFPVGARKSRLVGSLLKLLNGRGKER